jgi:glutathione S-transferase
LSAYRAGIEKQIELVTPDSQDDSLLRSQNPLGKIPVLQKPDGSFLFDSRVIIDYFNRLGGGLIPMDGPERDIVLSRSAMAEGLIDASLLVVYSDRYSGGEVPSKVWLELQLGKIDTTLNFLEKDILNWSNPSGFDAANIGLGSALAYMSFRNVREWKTDRPKLQKWFDNIAYNLPGFSQTAPKG